ncbi:MAG TPA: GuaB3 family IMP dehydrogenase-related protein [Acidimicrobiales bacterium]|nr:GuaB3 family IMP dehydrogenase-related protein [Acidimicrobiales bacterium]
MAEVEIGRGKSGRRAYGLDDVVIVPSRRTRDPEDIDISWEIDAFRLELPLMAAAKDAVVSPATAIAMGRLGGLGVLNLEGLWTRYEDPEPCLSEIASLDLDKATHRMQQLYAEPIKHQLVSARIREIKDAGVVSCASVSPQRTRALAPAILDGELDLLVIQGTVVSAEHVSKSQDPLNLKRFIRELDLPVVVGGCASYQAALHLMRTGAVGVLVGVGPAAGSTARGALGMGVPQATAIADAAGARMRHLDETGVYCHIIADGGMERSGDLCKAIACGADAVMLDRPLAAAHEAPGRGCYWDMEAVHPSLPRGAWARGGARASLREILLGPAHRDTGRVNLFGALRASMATAGYETVKEFQSAELAVAASADSGDLAPGRALDMGPGR